jgi:hypothetical protein
MKLEAMIESLDIQPLTVEVSDRHAGSKRLPEGRSSVSVTARTDKGRVSYDLLMADADLPLIFKSYPLVDLSMVFAQAVTK